MQAKNKDLSSQMGNTMSNITDVHTRQYTAINILHVLCLWWCC